MIVKTEREGKSGHRLAPHRRSPQSLTSLYPDPLIGSMLQKEWGQEQEPVAAKEAVSPESKESSNKSTNTAEAEQEVALVLVANEAVTLGGSEGGGEE